MKIYAQEDREIARFRELSHAFRGKQLSLTRVRGAMVSLIGIFTGMGTVLVLFVGGLHVIQGRISLGDFVAFNAYLAQLAWPTVALGWIVNVFQRAAGAMRRLDDVMTAAPAIEPPRGGVTSAAPIDGDVEIRGLTFAYEGAAERPALTDVRLSIQKGSRVAIVGAVGSGKSTLAHLIAKIYPAPQGPCSSAARTSPPLRSSGFAPESVSFRRRRSCFHARFATTSRSAVRKPKTHRSRLRSTRHGSTRTSRRFPMDWQPSSASAGTRCRAASANEPHWRAPWRPIPTSSSWTTRCPRWTPTPSARSWMRSQASAAGGR